jgi:hypothetical protein
VGSIVAVESTIGGSGTLFVGEDKTLRFELAGVNVDGSISTTVAVDMTGWAMVFDVRKKDASADPAILSMTAFSLTGVFNAVRATNTQRASLPVTDDQLNLFRAKSYRWSWKRTDASSETVLGWGTFGPQKATAP